MKNLIALTILAASVLGPITAKANDYNSPSPAIRAELLKAVLANPLVDAALKQAAKESSLNIKKCTLKIEEASGELYETYGKGNVDGTLTLQQDCINAEGEVGVMTTIEASVYSSKGFVNEIRVGRAG